MNKEQIIKYADNVSILIKGTLFFGIFVVILVSFDAIFDTNSNLVVTYTYVYYVMACVMILCYITEIILKRIYRIDFQ